MFERLPELDALRRPLAIYGNTVHDRCSRVHFFNEGLFAETFDDEGARRGWCLYRLGCKGPVTHNACATTKWNGGVSSPIDAGHPCIGCSEPGFWDAPGFYVPLADAAALRERPLSPAAQRGSTLFNDGCVYCHEPAASGFSTPPAQIPQAYAAQGGRSHRRQFSVEEWAEIVQFLGESPP